MDMLGQQLPCTDSTLFLPREGVKTFTEQLASVSVNCLAPILGNEHPVRLALPPGMRQARHGSRPQPFSFREFSANPRKRTVRRERSPLFVSHWSTSGLPPRIS